MGLQDLAGNLPRAHAFQDQVEILGGRIATAASLKQIERLARVRNSAAKRGSSG